MLSSVVLVLREVLEAALIVSLLAALTIKLKLTRRWGLWALAGGLLGSWALANYANDITQSFEGAGQELLNVILLFGLMTSLVTIGWLVIPLAFSQLKNTQHLSAKDSDIQNFQPSQLIYQLFVVAVSCAAAREGSEIWIYLSSFLAQADALYPVLVGGAIGGGIGISLGAIAYYLFIFMAKKNFIRIFLLVTSLIVGGLAIQMAKELMQIGWLESTAPVWNSAFLIDEHSLIGELFYALLGYEAKPTLFQCLFYLLAIAPVLCGVVWRWISLRQDIRYLATKSIP